jgi:4-amino-4-deoxy-L-arabinose transferase-like glycosyltransferase
MRYRFWLTLILLAAAALRLVGLVHVSPPGLAHDEVAHWLINERILVGEHAIYFTEAYGHEAGFHYLQSLFQLALGDHALALRLPAAFCGLLLVAVTFALGRRLFGLRLALLAAAWLALLFYPVFYSRLGLRAISLPLVAGLSAYCWVVGARAGLAAGRNWRAALPWLALAGALAGLSLHTYMAARAVPIFYAVYLLYLGLFHRQKVRALLPALALFWLCLLLVALPLLYYLLSHQGAEVRISEIDGPLQALKSGQLGPVIGNSWRALGMFGWSGDPLWRQNVAGRPVFEPVTAFLFYLGLVIALWRWRDRRYAFVLLWLSTAAIPSIVTIDAPSSIRMSNSLPLLTLFPAIAIHSLGRLSTETGYLSTDFGKKWGIWVIAILLLLAIGYTVQATFRLWPANEEVQFVWQQSLTEASRYIDQSSQATAAAVGGWTPETMDPPTMELTLRRDDLGLRYFNPGQSLIVPALSDGPALIVHPALLPLDEALAAALFAQGMIGERRDSFVVYEVRPADWRPQVSRAEPLGSELTWLGYDVLAPCPLDGAALAEPCSLELLTYWRVDQQPPGERRFFPHLVGGAAAPVAQDDGLGAPAAHWQPGDVLLQRHSLVVPAGGPYELRLGLYDPASTQRLLTADGGDYFTVRP